MSRTWQRRCSGNVFTTSCFDSRCWNLRPPRNINGMKVDIGILRKGDGPQEWSECIELTSQLLGGCWRMQTCKQMPHLYPNGCSYYISHGHSWYNYIHLETLEKRCGQHSWKFAWVEATNSHLKHSPAIQNSQRLAQENCVTNCITFRVLGIRKERHQFLPFTSIALENLAILMGQVLPLAGAGHVDCLKPVSTALKSLFEGWLEES